jgi:rubredoxin
MSRFPSRRRVLRGALALLAFVPWIDRARAAPPTQIWKCTFGDCDPYFYDPTEGAPNPMDPDHPIPPGVAFEDLPDDWICPICGSEKKLFKKVKEKR